MNLLVKICGKIVLSAIFSYEMGVFGADVSDALTQADSCDTAFREASRQHNNTNALKSFLWKAFPEDEDNYNNLEAIHSYAQGNLGHLFNYLDQKKISDPQKKELKDILLDISLSSEQKESFLKDFKLKIKKRLEREEKRVNDRYSLVEKGTILNFFTLYLFGGLIRVLMENKKSDQLFFGKMVCCLAFGVVSIYGIYRVLERQRTKDYAQKIQNLEELSLTKVNKDDMYAFRPFIKNGDFLKLLCALSSKSASEYSTLPY